MLVWLRLQLRYLHLLRSLCCVQLRGDLYLVNIVRGYPFFLQIRALLFALRAPRPHAMQHHPQAE